jgi:hypothetical protein
VDRFGRPQRGVQYSPYEGDKPSFEANIIEVIKTHQMWTAADGGLLGSRASKERRLVEENINPPTKGISPHARQISQSARVRRPLGGVEYIILFSAIPCLMAASKEEGESVKWKWKV